MPRTVDLFDFFAKAATKTFADCEDVFVCPLCLQTFDSLSGLNRAHLWPEALGSRIFTLACRKCNSRIGSKIEKHEVERVKRLGQNRTPFRQQIEGVVGDTGGLLSIDSRDGEPLVIIEWLPKSSNPKALNKQDKAFKTGEIINKQVTWSFQTRYNIDTARLTFLHFAYMALFHLTGYGWILSSLARRIRQQLNQPNRATFPIYLLTFTSEETLGATSSIQPVLLEVSSPAVLRGYLVITPELKYEGNRRKAIWLPVSDNVSNFFNLSDFQGTHFDYGFLTSIGRDPGGFAVYERAV